MNIAVSYSTGATLVATLERLSDGYEWRQAATAGWEAAGTSSFANRKITLTEGSSEKGGSYASADLSSLGDALRVRIRIHDDADTNDKTIAVFERWVIGSEDYDVSDVIAISGDTTAADNAELMFDGTGYAGGTTKLGVDVVSISGDTAAADNLEAFTDGTGYAGGTIKLGVDAVAISGDSGAADNLEAMFDGAGYAGGTIPLNVNVMQISGDATAADNCEAFFDGAGYAGGTIKLDVNLVSAAANTITASALATDAVDEIVDAITAEGVTLAPGALVPVVVEAGGDALNLQEVISLMASAMLGVVSGAGTTTVTFKAAGDSGTTRIVATVDQDGNRSAVTLTPPA